jgi:hypothetical protein
MTSVADHGVGVGYVDELRGLTRREEVDAERLVQPFGKRGDDLGAAVSVRVAQDSNAIRLGLDDEQIPVRRDARHPRMVEPAHEEADLEALGYVGKRPIRARDELGAVIGGVRLEWGRQVADGDLPPDAGPVRRPVAHRRLAEQELVRAVDGGHHRRSVTLAGDQDGNRGKDRVRNSGVHDARSVVGHLTGEQSKATNRCRPVRRPRVDKRPRWRPRRIRTLGTMDPRTRRRPRTCLARSTPRNTCLRPPTTSTPRGRSGMRAPG